MIQKRISLFSKKVTFSWKCFHFFFIANKNISLILKIYYNLFLPVFEKVPKHQIVYVGANYTFAANIDLELFLGVRKKWKFRRKMTNILRKKRKPFLHTFFGPFLDRKKRAKRGPLFGQKCPNSEMTFHIFVHPESSRFSPDFSPSEIRLGVFVAANA